MASATSWNSTFPASPPPETLPAGNHSFEGRLGCRVANRATWVPPDMRFFLGLLVVACAVGAIGAVLLLRGAGSEPIVAPQDPMPGRLLVGLQDDPSFRWDADRAVMLDRAREAAASLLRTVVVWKDTAPTRPVNAVDPFDPAYRLDDVDDLVRSAQQRGMELLVTIWGTPEWANGGQPPN